MNRNIPPKLYTFIYSWKSPNSWRHFFDVRSVLTSYFRAVSCVWGLWLYQQTYLEKQAKSNQEKPTTWYSSLFIIIICILHQFTQCYKTRKKSQKYPADYLHQWLNSIYFGKINFEHKVYLAKLNFEPTQTFQISRTSLPRTTSIYIFFKHCAFVDDDIKIVFD